MDELLSQCSYKQAKIKDLQEQVRFELIPTQYAIIHGKLKCVERKCEYIADFVYFDNAYKQIVVEDAKGYHTPEYIIKRKLMLHVHGIAIKEV